MVEILVRRGVGVGPRKRRRDTTSIQDIVPPTESTSSDEEPLVRSGAERQVCLRVDRGIDGGPLGLHTMTDGSDDPARCGGRQAGCSSGGPVVLVERATTGEVGRNDSEAPLKRLRRVSASQDTTVAAPSAQVPSSLIGALEYDLTVRDSDIDGSPV